MKYKPDYSIVNHTAGIKKFLSIRRLYRVYLAEMEEYGFIPDTFRVWYSWHTNTPLRHKN